MRNAFLSALLEVLHHVPPLFYSLVETFQRRGVGATAQIALSFVVDLTFDWRYGTETIRRTALHPLDVPSPNKIHAVHYQATRARPFRHLLSHLDLPTGGTFVDLGSGKGRVLLLAANGGFARVRGIEFSAELCRIARQNVQLFMAKTGTSSQIEIVEEDVATYQVRDEETVFFMYNPFGPVVINAFLSRLEASLKRTPRDTWLIYSTPVHDDILSSCRALARWSEHKFGGTRFVVYRATTFQPSLWAPYGS